MHGDVAYCKKHGHDWTLLKAWVRNDGFRCYYRECPICGIREVHTVWNIEEEE